MAITNVIAIFMVGVRRLLKAAPRDERQRSLLRSKAWFRPSQARLCACKASFVAPLGLLELLTSEVLRLKTSHNKNGNNLYYCHFYGGR